MSFETEVTRIYNEEEVWRAEMQATFSAHYIPYYPTAKTRIIIQR